MSASTQETLCQPVVGTVHTNSLSCEFGFSEHTHLCSLQRGTVSALSVFFILLIFKGLLPRYCSCLERFSV